MPVTVTGCSDQQPEQPLKPTVVAAGVPSTIGLTGDYDRIYGELELGGMTVFFPYFATDEYAGGSPGTEYRDFYGLETEFAGQTVRPGKCDPASPAFSQLAPHHVKLLLSADVMYPIGAPMPLLTDDPLARLIACAGRNNIQGVLNYDEPVFNKLPVEALQAVYDRVKAIDSTMPVLMINGPILRSAQTGAADVEAYLAEVKAAQVAADIVGFDVYPIPDTIRNELTTPYRAGAAAPDPMTVISEYARWLTENGDGKPTWMVLQAFTKPVTTQFHVDESGNPYPCETRTDIPGITSVCGSGTRGPTEEELRGMVKASLDGGATAVGWYGASFVTADPAVWESVIKVSREIR